MLKLCRNTLRDYKQIFFHNESIQWQYFKELVKLQEESELHAGTKIRRRHINYFKEKMKVNLAAQTFSCSVADAFQYCSESLKIKEFLNCGQTIKFCRTINDIFDFLNTRNFLNKSEFKKPLRKCGALKIYNFIENYIKYISNLNVEIVKKEGGQQVKSKISILESQRRTELWADYLFD